MTRYANALCKEYYSRTPPIFVSSRNLCGRAARMRNIRDINSSPFAVLLAVELPPSSPLFVRRHL